MKYNIWNKWDPLKVCMLGNNYAPEFFDGLNTKAESPLKRICEETLEDLEGYKTILQDFGVEVIQPELDPTERFVDNPSRYPRGPLQPRDTFMVLGNECYVTEQDHSAIFNRLNKYSTVTPSNSTWSMEYPQPINEEEYNSIAGSSYPSYNDFMNNRNNQSYFEDVVWEELTTIPTNTYCRFISSATAFPLGKKIVVGTSPPDYKYSKLELENYMPGLQNFDVIEASMDGHTDGNFHPIKPGAILSLKNVQTYSETFPGWDVCYLPDQSWDKVDSFTTLKKKNRGKWYLAGEENNDEFTDFVEKWLQDWVGFVEETVFDVNVLMLDEHHCCVSNPNNEQVNTFLKKHKVEPVYVPWRHRYFWDGGLHCITLELDRQGTQKEYF